MTNREYLIKLLEEENEAAMEYLTCEACAYRNKTCDAFTKTCSRGHAKWLKGEREKEKITEELNSYPKCGAEMEICDDVSGFQPAREDVEKAFEMFEKTCGNCKNAWTDCHPRDDRSCFSWEKMEVEQCQPKDDTSHPFADDVLMGGD